MDCRVERLHPTVQDLWDAGQVAHRLDRDGGILEHCQGASGRVDLEAQTGQPAREGGQTSLVAN
jgi:hypothetical protein